MILYPHAKVNIGLYITKRRSDGYHELETVFYPLPIHDILEIKKWDEDVWEQTGLEIRGGGNLCLKALEVFRRETGIDQKIYLHLHKQIPMQAGLGGGSSDASFVLRGLDEIFETHLGYEKLNSMATEIGADCPFFLLDDPAFGKGIGEKLEKFNLELSEYQWVLIKPNFSVSTQEAFQKITPKPAPEGWTDLLLESPEKWGVRIENKFQLGLEFKYPEIIEITNRLEQKGVLYSSLTGTGSVVYGIFPKTKRITLEDFSDLGEVILC